VGIVVRLNASTDHYQLTREVGGKRVEQAIDVLMPLYENDVLWVSCQRKDNGEGESEKIRMTLQLADGEKGLTCEDNPYTLKRQSPHSVFGNFAGFLQEVVHSLFEGLNDNYHRAQLTSLAVRPAGRERDEPLFMSLIGRSGARLAAGVRDLHLAWSGGQAPYTIRIRAAGAAKPLVAMNGLQETHVHLQGVALQQGDYAFEIEDARERLSRTLRAVPPSEIPALPRQAFSEAKSTAETQLQATVYAAWLSEQKPPLWSLEAYQHVIDIAPEFYPAKLLRLRLEGAL
jgi:hypothetical protein